MTFAIENSAPSTDRTVGIAAGIDLTASVPLIGPAMVIAGASVSPGELCHASSDAIIARSAKEFRSIKFVEIQYYVVSAGGFDLAVELLESGDLDPASRIVWSLDLPLLESLSRLKTISFPEDVAVCRIGGHMEKSVITTAGGSLRKVELESFMAGMEVSAALFGPVSLGTKSDDQSEMDRAMELLRRKHLSVLEILSPVDAREPAAAARTEQPLVDSSRLENDLILLKRRYDALERKYTALANSRLGALTLRLWDRNKPRRNNAISAKDDEK